MIKTKIDFFSDTNPVTSTGGFLKEGIEPSEVLKKFMEARHKDMLGIFLNDFENTSFIIDPHKVFSVSMSVFNIADENLIQEVTSATNQGKEQESGLSQYQKGIGGGEITKASSGDSAKLRAKSGGQDSKKEK